jgi:outer membrane protein TolC
LFHQLLLLEANMSLQEEIAASARDRHEQTLARHRAGQASNLDELNARLDAQNQQINFQNSVMGYENALDTLKHLLMIPQEETVALEGSLQGYAVTGFDREPALSSESMQITALRKSIDVLEAQKRSAQALHYAPSLSLSWGATPLYSDMAGAWSDSSQFSIMLSMKLDSLLPWSSARGQIGSLNDAISKQQSLLQESELNRQNTLHRLRRNIMQSASTLEALHLNITLAEETFASHEAAYRRGATDLQSVNNARDSLSSARNRLLSEQYSLALLALELEKELNVAFGSLLF